MTGPGTGVAPNADRALRLLCGRVTRTVEQVGDRFPLYADPDSGRWTSTSRGSWTGGYWAGLLALRAAFEGGAEQRASALAVRARLSGWLDADTVCRGMVFWYGELVSRLGMAPPAEATMEAAHALAAAFDPELGAVPWGTAFGDTPRAVKPDGAAGVVPLLAWSARRPDGPPDGAELAHRHLLTHLGTEPGYWSRGHAWLLLAAADGSVYLPDPPIARARQLASAWLDRFGTGLPPARLGPRPGDPVDSSAAAIAAVALLTLAAVDPDPRWPRAGADLLMSIVRRSQHTAGPAIGGIQHGCYDLAGATATAHELIWGDFFVALGLGMLTGLVPQAR